MAEKNKIPKELDDKIQSLAGEIYVQIEEKVTSFVLEHHQDSQLTTEKIEQNPQYQALIDTINAEKLKFSELEEKLDLNLKDYQSNTNTLEEKIKEQQQLITNNSELNEAKLTDTETVLQKKLAENSKLEESVKKLLVETEQQKEQLTQSNSTVKEQNEQLDLLRNSSSNLQKNDQAKSATLDIQNQQISDLQNQLNVALAEMELYKAEQTQHSSTNKLALTEYQQREKLLKQQLDNIAIDKKNDQQTIENQVLKLTDLENNNQLMTLNLSEQTEKVKTQQEELLAKQQQLDIQVRQLADVEENHNKIILEKNSEIGELHTNKEQLETELDSRENLLKENQSKQNTQEEILVELKKEHLVFQQDNAQLQQTIEQTQLQLSEEKSAHSDQQKLDQEQIKKIAQRLSESEEKLSNNAHVLMQLQQSYDNVSVSFEQAKEEVNHHQLIIENLTKDLKQATDNIEQNQQRHAAQIEKRDKQESEYSKARDTIKYLRDENTELTQKLDQEVSELETKLTEYRLRFEYAQKELAKK